MSCDTCKDRQRIRALMHEAPDEETRREMERLVNKLDR